MRISWHSPHASVILGAVTPDLRGLPGSRVPPVLKVPELDPPVLRRVFEDTAGTRDPSTATTVPVHLSVSCSASIGFQISSLGFVQRSPLHRYQHHVSSPESLSEEGFPSVQHCHVLDIARPCRSSRLRRFTPHFALQVYCTLQPAMGFELFPTGPPVVAFPQRTVLPVFPELAVRTLQSFSPSDSRVASPRPLPPRCCSVWPSPANWFQLSFTQPRGLSPSKDPLPPPVFPLTLARCSLGLRSPSGFSPQPRCPFFGHL